MNDDNDHSLILTYPDPLLRVRTEPVEDIGQEIQDLIDKMIKLMVEAPGIGLAANQIGQLRRVIVFEQSPEEQKRNPGVLINPEIVQSEGQITRSEGCLSVLDFWADVTRKAKVRVRGLDRDGKPVERDAEGLHAICLQHEIDHLNGILVLDHISSLKRALYKKRLKKIVRES